MKSLIASVAAKASAFYAAHPKTVYIGAAVLVAVIVVATLHG